MMQPNHRHYRAVSDEMKLLKKKTIQKAKRKNQYTTEFRFGSETNLSNMQKSVLATVSIPKTLHSLFKFRLSSNLQIPGVYRAEDRLGDLSIDPFSFNYSVIRIDERQHTIVLTLEPQNLPTVPFESVHKVFQQYCPQITQNLLLFQKSLEKIDQQTLILESKVAEFEQQIIKNRPYCCYLSRYKDGKRVTLQKIISQKQLDCMKIDKEILLNYILHSRLIPSDIYYDPNDQLGTINKMFSSNINRQAENTCKLELITYDGLRYYNKFTIRHFSFFNEQEQAYYEYDYYIRDDQEMHDFQDTRMKRYFNDDLNQSKKSLISSSTSSSEKGIRCGFKQI